MAKGILNIQAADGAVIGLHVPDGLASGERQISLGANLSGITAYHLLQGNLAVSNSTITQGFNTTLYTSGSATTGIDMDTQWGNTVEEKFGGLVWLKDRAEATNNFWYDTIRGATKEINSNTTEAEATLAGGLTAFNSTGFTVGADAGHNSTTNNMVSWNFQTTHRITGTTNHGKAYTCHYNPFTGFTIVKYEGSGTAGHEIPHHLGRKLGLVTVKGLYVGSTVWQSTYDGTNRVYLNLTNAQIADSYVITLNDNSIAFNNSAGTFIDTNASSNTYIMYGWANSYTDESNKLIGNYEIGVYQGTGAAGNKVTTRGKPAWVMIKRLDSTGDWTILDNQRDGSHRLLANSSNVEDVYNLISINNYGFTINQDGTVWTYGNASGGQYLYIVAYDTNSNGGGSYYPLASDTANVQINNALIPLAQGIDSNGAKNTIISKNETITGLAYTAGKNYVYCDKNGSYGTTTHRPRYLESELVRTYVGESPNYYDVDSNKWYSCDTGTELVTNGTFNSDTSGWTVVNGTFVVSNGSGLLTNSGGVFGQISQIITTVIGEKYRIKVDIGGTTASPTYLQINDKVISSGTSSYYTTFIATTTSTIVSITNNAQTNAYTYIDSVSCFKVSISPTTEITNSRNYLNHIVHADNDGGVLYVEELPKIEYKDVVKANEYKGKNACTAWVNFDGTTTPPTIRDSYNVSAVIRIATGAYDIYFKEAMDNINYASNASSNKLYSWADSGQAYYNRTVSKFSIMNVENGTGYNTTDISVQVFGGRN